MNPTSKFKKAPLSLIVAPAGCGKTHLLVDSAASIGGRQLILTHTTAGVKELKTRLEKKNVSKTKYIVKTIDSFCFSYVSAYPRSSNLDLESLPTGGDWSEVKQSFSCLVQLPFIQDILSASYSGILVDEYQDCSIIQHHIITLLSKILPCRIVGDPMQSIFNFGKGDEALIPWSKVEKDFIHVGELTTEWRWKNANNEDLGVVIGKSRAQLQENKMPDIIKVNTKAISNIRVERNLLKANQISRANSVANDNPDDSVAIIFPIRRASCWALTASLKNRYHVLEDADCRDLLLLCETLDNELSQSNGQLLTHSLALAKTFIAKLPSDSAMWITRIVEGNPPKIRIPDKKRILTSMIELYHNPDIECLSKFSTAVESFPGITYKSSESWWVFKKALLLVSSKKHTKLTDAVSYLRMKERAAGRRIPKRCVSTTLLLKGLEFDHVIIPDLSEFRGNREHFYVAISRARKTVTILCPTD